MDNIIEIRSLSTYYDNVCALENINFDIKRRDFLAILGPNGGGKSTLLKCILGLIKPTKGSINIIGKTNNDGTNHIGYVPQFSKFDKKFPINVLDVVVSGTMVKSKKLFHKYTKKDNEYALKILKQLNIYELKDRQIGMLSGGQLQRVLIARALTLNPEILILDEPTASLDANSKTQIYSLLKELNKTKTIIIVSHDIDFVSSYVTSIACLNKTLHYHGNPVLNSDIIEHVYGCPVDLIAHGIPHRVLNTHKE